MSHRGTRPRTLLVGPLGQRPWISRNELVAQLEDLGHDVQVNGVGGPELVPPLEPLPSQVGVARNSLPSISMWFARMLWRWRRTTNAMLREGHIDHVVVWDPLLAGLCRLARPAGTEVVWVPSHGEAPRFYESVVRAALSLTADRVVVSTADDARWVRGHITYSQWPLPAPTGAVLLDEWVVLASSIAPDDATLDRLAREAAYQPAAAVIFDARDDDRVVPAVAERLRAVCGAAHVWWAAGDEWLEWLGGAPARAIDPNRVLSVDQRHARVLSEGGVLWAVDGANDGNSAPLLTAVKTSDGWTEFAWRDDQSGSHSESEWAHDVFGERARSTGERVLAHGVAVDTCPMCGSRDRRVTGHTDGATTVLQCRECGLRHADAVIPVHPGPATHPTIDAGAITLAIANRQLDVVAEVGILPGRLLLVGDEPAALVACATERGWGAAQMTVEDFVAGQPTESVDVIVFNHSLETASDPVRVLRHAREYYLEAGGHVFINAANARSLSRYAQRSYWTEWKPGDRVTYPDPWTVRQMLQRGGFQTQLLHSESYPDVPATGVEFARRVGLVSERLARVVPPVAMVLDRTGSERPLRTATQWVDRHGFGRNVVAVGRAI